MNKNLIYIISPGHSGSTITDMLLGNIKGIFSCGELTYLPWQLHRNNLYSLENVPGMACSCGKMVKECPFWKKVVEHISNVEGFEIIKYPLRFNITICSSQRYRKYKKLTYHIIEKRIYRDSITGKLPKIFSKLIRIRYYRRINRNWLLISTIGNVANSKYIVDSTKDIVRFDMLNSKRTADAYLIILIRDVRGIASSAIKLGHDPITAAMNWKSFYEELVQYLRFNKNIKYFSVYYEDICLQTNKVLEKISNNLGIDGVNDFDGFINTKNNHIVAGNPIRYSGKMKIKMDDSWKYRIENNNYYKIIERISNNTMEMLDRNEIIKL